MNKPPTLSTEQQAVFERPRRLCFRHPTSHHVAVLAADDSRCWLQITPREPAPFRSQITISLHLKHAGLTATAVAKGHARELQQQVVHLTGSEFIPIEPLPGYDRGFLWGPRAFWEDQPYDCPVIVLEHAEAFVLLSLLGPSDELARELRAINKRAFEVVRDSLTLGEPPASAPPSAPADNRQDSSTPPSGNGPGSLDAGSYRE